MSTPYDPPTEVRVCARHPDRVTGLTCTRCDRPACPECLREASVGMQCVDCVTEGARTQRRGRPLRSGDRPVVVPALILVNLAVFVVTVADGGSIAGNLGGVVGNAGALVPLAVADGDWWRLVASGFLHNGPVHLLFNMLALWLIGRDIELALGRLRFAALYGVSLLGGSAAVMLLGAPNQAVAGASGAIFGMMGALVVLLRRMRQSATPALVIIGINVVLSVTLPGISLLGHLGGLVAGAAVAVGMSHGPARSRPTAGLVIAAGIAAALLVVIALRVLALALV